jgi:hypothetical protein
VGVLTTRPQLSVTNLLSESRMGPDDRSNFLKNGWRLLLENPPDNNPRYKNKIIMRKAIKPHEHLSVTLRFLATGRVYAALRFSVAISPYILNLVIPNTSA